MKIISEIDDLGGLKNGKGLTTQWISGEHGTLCIFLNETLLMTWMEYELTFSHHLNSDEF